MQPWKARGPMTRSEAGQVTFSRFQQSADGQEPLREADALQEPAFVESGVADVREGGGQVDLLQEGVALVQGNLLADLPVFGHVVLEGEHPVAEDAAALADGHFGGKVLRVEEFLPVGRVAATVLVVPDVIGPLFGAGGRRDAEDFFKGHCQKFLTNSMSFLSITFGSITETFWNSLNW